jgi:hypothetical protein
MLWCSFLFILGVGRGLDTPEKNGQIALDVGNQNRKDAFDITRCLDIKRALLEI